MADPPLKKPLKLKLNTSSQIRRDSIDTAGGSSTPKIILKLGGSTPKTGRTSSVTFSDHPAPKIVGKSARKAPISISTSFSKKRNSIAEDDLDSLTSASAPPTGTGIKRIKLTAKPKTPLTPSLKLKVKGKPLHREPGVGYDSEASDREIDPAIEEEFILRMPPGDDCEYVRQAIEERTLGNGKSIGDIRLKFFERRGRRAILVVRKTLYAAILVDLPCIVEGMKSWDKRGWWKTGDIHQMLLVLGTVSSEDQAKNYAIPNVDLDPHTYAYHHGLTPPMKWVKKRRFRQRVSTRTIEAVEAEVERLLRLDAESEGYVKYELVDLAERQSRAVSQSQQSIADMGYDEEQDAEGEMDDGYFGMMHEDDEQDLVANLENILEGEGDDDTEIQVEADTVPAMDASDFITDSEVATPAGGIASKEDSGDEESGSEDDDEADGEGSIDEEEAEAQADLQRSKEEIADLEAAIANQTAEMNGLSSELLKKRKLVRIQSLKQDLALKKAQIGEGEED